MENIQVYRLEDEGVQSLILYILQKKKLKKEYGYFEKSFLKDQKKNPVYFEKKYVQTSIRNKKS